MNKRHYRITIADALHAHERALEIRGGLDGIPNPALIESAIARPYSGYFRSIAKKAAVLVDAVAKNHGFADGNKRTAIILMHLLLEKSGYKLEPLDRYESIENATEQLVLDIVGPPGIRWRRQSRGLVKD